MCIGCSFIGRSGDNCKPSFFIRKSLYSLKRNSLACVGVVVLLNGSDGSQVEDGKTGGGDTCLGAAHGEESEDWGSAVLLSCIYSHTYMRACVTSDIG